MLQFSTVRPPWVPAATGMTGRRIIPPFRHSGAGRDPRQVRFTAPIWGSVDTEVRMPVLMGRAAKVPCTYIVASKRDGVLYTGVTSDLWGRMADHTDGNFKGFTKTYAVKTLVYYEMHPTMDEAILREKRIKEWQRAWKIRLINGFNPEWSNLYDHADGQILDSPVDQARERGA